MQQGCSIRHQRGVHSTAQARHLLVHCSMQEHTTKECGSVHQNTVHDLLKGSELSCRSPGRKHAWLTETQKSKSAELLTSAMTAWHRAPDAALLPTCPADPIISQIAVSYALSFIDCQATMALGRCFCALGDPKECITSVPIQICDRHLQNAAMIARCSCQGMHSLEQPCTLATGNRVASSNTKEPTFSTLICKKQGTFRNNMRWSNTRNHWPSPTRHHTRCCVLRASRD